MIDGKVVLGITQGDVNGIGIEVMLQAFADTQFVNMFVPVFYGSGRAFAYYRKVLGQQGVNTNVIRDIDQLHPHRINLIECGGEEVIVEMGQPSQASGRFAHMALERFFDDWNEGKLDGLVTLPVNKLSMQSEGFPFPGHTEYLAEKTGSNTPLMLMVSDTLRLAVVTGHIPLSEVAPKLTEENILAKIRLLHETLRMDFSLEKPRIAILSLNPHAGEGGMLGHEEMDIIEPAIAAANNEKMIAVGPFAADGFFGSGQWREYDAILAMYHDQGLTPFKALSFDMGVNFTAGLPLIRTSPAHGTAYQLVGKGIASPTPFRQAVYLAIDVVRSRQLHQKIAETALPTK